MKTRALWFVAAACMPWLNGCGCNCPKPADSPYRCVVTQGPSSETARLVRQANASQFRWEPSYKLHCEQDESEPLVYECESVDDLQALLGTGYACGPDGAERQSLCPSYEGRIKQVPPSYADRPCGSAACPNKEVEVTDSSGTLTRILFYDDPGCHAGPPAPACEPAAHPCY